MQTRLPAVKAPKRKNPCLFLGPSESGTRTLGLDLVDLTFDGNTTQGVLADLVRAPAAADVVTLSAGGNDLLGGVLPRAILRRFTRSLSGSKS